MLKIILLVGPVHENLEAYYKNTLRKEGGQRGLPLSEEEWTGRMGVGGGRNGRRGEMKMKLGCKINNVRNLCLLNLVAIL